jgi:hypothetical protein
MPDGKRGVGGGRWRAKRRRVRVIMAIRVFVLQTVMARAGIGGWTRHATQHPATTRHSYPIAPDLVRVARQDRNEWNKHSF